MEREWESDSYSESVSQACILEAFFLSYFIGNVVFFILPGFVSQLKPLGLQLQGNGI